MEEKKQTKSLIERMKEKALQQKSYGGDYKEEEAKIYVRDCPNCGAGRANNDGLTNCAYCGFEFLSVKLTDGINIKKENNSGK